MCLKEYYNLIYNWGFDHLRPKSLTRHYLINILTASKVSFNLDKIN